MINASGWSLKWFQWLVYMVICYGFGKHYRLLLRFTEEFVRKDKVLWITDFWWYLSFAFIVSV
jgi:hypothetical protein